jgi:uncharacterized protein YndB with AHSA1/START domain
MVDVVIETEIRRSPAEVFAYVTDPAKLPTWQTASNGMGSLTRCSADGTIAPSTAGAGGDCVAHVPRWHVVVVVRT